MNAFRGLSRGIVPELESAWLFKIAHNVCLSRRRSSWRRGKIEAPNNFEVLQEVIPGREQVSDELIGLQDVLEKMPENQRRAILLREWQGLTYREISAELGLTQAAVETLIFRARRALAQGLEQDADTWKKRLRRGANVGGNRDGSAAACSPGTGHQAQSCCDSARDASEHRDDRFVRCCDDWFTRPSGLDTHRPPCQFGRAYSPKAGSTPGNASRRDDQRTGSRPVFVRTGSTARTPSGCKRTVHARARRQRPWQREG